MPSRAGYSGRALRLGSRPAIITSGYTTLRSSDSHPCYRKVGSLRLVGSYYCPSAHPSRPNAGHPPPQRPGFCRVGQVHAVCPFTTYALLGTGHR